MDRMQQSRAEFAAEELAGADIIGGVIIGGMLSLVIWAGIISFFVF